MSDSCRGRDFEAKNAVSEGGKRRMGRDEGGDVEVGKKVELKDVWEVSPSWVFASAYLFTVCPFVSASSCIYTRTYHTAGPKQ